MFDPSSIAVPFVGGPCCGAPYIQPLNEELKPRLLVKHNTRKLLYHLIICQQTHPVLGDMMYLAYEFQRYVVDEPKPTEPQPLESPPEPPPIEPKPLRIDPIDLAPEHT